MVVYFIRHAQSENTNFITTRKRPRQQVQSSRICSRKNWVTTNQDLGYYYLYQQREKLRSLPNLYLYNLTGLQLHDKSLGRILLALLYTLLLEGELRSAVELTELLIRQQDARSTLSVCNQDATTKTNILSLLQKV